MKGVDANAMRRRVGRTAVGPTTLRNMACTKGKRSELLHFFQETKLPDFSNGDYLGHLDQLTVRLQRELEFDFGPARKALNLFIRDLFYFNITREFFGLLKCEEFLECPLDSYTMKGIKNDAKLEIDVPTVSRLTRQQSVKFQQAAADIAIKRGTCRVHLDLIYWTDRQ